MGLWDWLKGGEFRTSGLANPSVQTLDAFGATSNYTGERVTVQAALELAAVRAAVAMISEAVGQLPLKVYRIMDNDDRIEARQHRMWHTLHDKPNADCIARVFWAATAAQLLIYENAFIYKSRGADGMVDELYHLDPTLVQVKYGPQGKRFVIEGPPEVVYTSDEVLHVVGFSTDGYYGSARVTQAKQTLGAAIARAKFEGGFYKRGARMPGFLQHPRQLSPKASKMLADQMAAWHGGVENMHKMPVLEDGLTFNGSGMDMQQMQFAELAEQTRTEIAVLFNIPPAYLGAKSGDSLTYATTESNQIQFAQMAVLPVATAIDKALSADPALLPWDVMYAEFVIESLLKADMKSRAEYWKTMKDVLNLDPAYIASRENIPHDAIKEPAPVPAQLNPVPNPAVVPLASVDNQSNG